ncbi:hypothetical protein ACIBQ0_09780 [Nocardia nova]|uniref:hypothetical protein n=1 Tax=Nocardia nova TaxID=37330 RepID=UPI0037B3C804
MKPAHHKEVGQRGRGWIAVAIVVAVALALHIGAAGYAVTHRRWTLSASLILLIAAKALLFFWFRAHRKRAR